jgi:hypothetical protein
MASLRISWQDGMQGTALCCFCIVAAAGALTFLCLLCHRSANSSVDLEFEIVHGFQQEVSMQCNMSRVA